MCATLVSNISPENIMMRDVYCNTLIELAKDDPRIIVLDSDLMKSMGMTPFLNAFPDRTFNCGVQEANMIGIAAGLSATGKIPFAHSFGTFATRRCYDQVFLSAAYAKLNIRVIGSDPGITAAYNGGTHMALEDMGIMRNIPEMTVIEPVDSIMFANIIRQLTDCYGVFYIRLLRKNAMKIYEDGSTFEIGKGVTLTEGNDVTIIASGLMVAEAIIASEKLKSLGIAARVVNIFTIKPIDKELIIKCAKDTGAIVTAENHNIIGGLGSAVAETLVEAYPVPMIRIGCNDHFGEVGNLDYLKSFFGLTSENIVANVKKVLRSKLNDPSIMES